MKLVQMNKETSSLNVLEILIDDILITHNLFICIRNYRFILCNSYKANENYLS
mgnify:CR=1 FL=1